MKVLSQYEEQYVSGGDPERGLGWAAGRRYDRRALIAGKLAGAGGFIAGAVGQLVGTPSAALQAVWAGLSGLTHTQQEVADYAKHFRETIGFHLDLSRR